MRSTTTVIGSTSASSHIPETASTLVAIDASIVNFQSLASGVLPGVILLILDGHQDGIEQITAAFQQHPEITQLHIVAHGSSAAIHLSHGQLNLDTIEQYAWELQSWFPAAALRCCALCLYACNVAAGEAGSKFLQKLHTFTGATIHAATLPIGNIQQDSNWNLDATYRHPGSKWDAQCQQPAPPPFTPTVLQNYQGLLATLSMANPIGG